MNLVLMSDARAAPLVRYFISLSLSLSLSTDRSPNAHAHDLQARDFSGTADPYAKIRLLPDRSNVWQTRIHKRTLNPEVKEWFRNNGLLLNTEKTFAINFHSNYQSARVDDSYLQPLANNTPIAKFLGLQIEGSVTWRAHVRKLSTP
ncbi:hypothetical protein J6590_070577 [Homalodisca vitripennis]|nr:hypothetical protein J6590_070577 [Homalodisca vitripennis]